MAVLLKTLPFKSTPLPPLSPSLRPISLNSPRPFYVCFKQRLPSTPGALRFSSSPSLRFVKLVPFASNGGETETAETQEPQIEVTFNFLSTRFHFFYGFNFLGLIFFFFMFSLGFDKIISGFWNSMFEMSEMGKKSVT